MDGGIRAKIEWIRESKLEYCARESQALKVIGWESSLSEMNDANQSRQLLQYLPSRITTMTGLFLNSDLACSQLALQARQHGVPAWITSEFEGIERSPPAGLHQLRHVVRLFWLAGSRTVHFVEVEANGVFAVRH